MQPEVVNRKNVFLVIFEGFCYKDLPLHTSESATMPNFPFAISGEHARYIGTSLCGSGDVKIFGRRGGLSDRGLGSQGF